MSNSPWSVDGEAILNSSPINQSELVSSTNDTIKLPIECYLAASAIINSPLTIPPMTDIYCAGPTTDCLTLFNFAMVASEKPRWALTRFTGVNASHWFKEISLTIGDLKISRNRSVWGIFKSAVVDLAVTKDLPCYQYSQHNDLENKPSQHIQRSR